MSLKFDLVKVDLARLPEAIKNYALEVLLEQAELMRALAQVYCPVDTGSLRDSIRVERGGEGEAWARVRVRAGGYVTNPKTGKIVDYAAIVEERQPFMRPAFEEVKPTVADMIRNRVVEKIE